MKTRSPLYWTAMASSVIAASFISQSNDFILVQELRARPSDIGITNAIESLGFLFLSIPFGHLLARFRATRVAATCAALDAALIGVLLFSFLSGQLTVQTIWLISGASGVVAVASGIAESSQVGRLFKDSELVAVSARRSVVTQTASVIIPLFAGFALQAGAAPALIVAAIGCALAASTLSWALSAHEKSPLDVVHENPESRATQKIWGAPLFAVSALLFLCNLSLAFASSVEILYQRHDVGMDFGLIGSAVAVGALGGIGGAIAAEPLIKRFPHSRVQIGMAACLILGVALFVAAPQTPPPTSVILVFAFAAIYNAAMSAFNVSLFAYVSVGFQSRDLPKVFGVLQTVGLGCIPFGALLGGVSGNSLGNQVTVLIWLLATVVLLVLAVSFARLLSARTNATLGS